MSAPRRGTGALVGLLLAATVAHGHSDACRSVDVSDDRTATVAGQLLADGWQSDPTDHAERLYSPDCS